MTIESILAPIEARAEAATEGPWLAGPMLLPTCKVYANDCKTLVAETMTMTSSERDSDASFIAHARQDIPTLCKLARSQAEVIAQLVEAIKDRPHSGNCHLNSNRPFGDKAREKWDAKGCDCWKAAAIAAASAVNVKGEQ